VDPLAIGGRFAPTHTLSSQRCITSEACNLPNKGVAVGVLAIFAYNRYGICDTDLVETTSGNPAAQTENASSNAELMLKGGVGLIEVVPRSTDRSNAVTVNDGQDEVVITDTVASVSRIIDSVTLPNDHENNDMDPIQSQHYQDDPAHRPGPIVDAAATSQGHSKPDADARAPRNERRTQWMAQKKAKKEQRKAEKSEKKIYIQQKKNIGKEDFGEESDEESWYPKYKDCECCKGFVYKCKGEACSHLKFCVCKIAEECDL